MQEQVHLRSASVCSDPPVLPGGLSTPTSPFLSHASPSTPAWHRWSLVTACGPCHAAPVALLLCQAMQAVASELHPFQSGSLKTSSVSVRKAGGLGLDCGKPGQGMGCGSTQADPGNQPPHSPAEHIGLKVCATHCPRAGGGTPWHIWSVYAIIPQPYPTAGDNNDEATGHERCRKHCPGPSLKM